MSLPSTQEPGTWSRLTGWERDWRFAEFLEYWAWRLRRAVWITIVACYVLSYNGLWRMTPDSGLYLCIARSIARGQGYLYHGEPNRLAYPGLPYLLAGMMKISEKHAIALADLVILISALLALALCYRLLKLVVRPGAAVVITVFIAVNTVIYEHAFMVLTDIPFFLGSMMVLAGGAMSGVLPAPRLHEEAQLPQPKERKLGFALLLAGVLLCAVMRPTFYVLGACALVACIVTALRLRQKRYLLGALGLAVCVGALYLVVAAADPRRAHTARDIYEEALSQHLATAVDNWQVPLANGWQLVSPELPFAFFAFSWGKICNSIVVAVLIAGAVWVLRRWPMALLWLGATLVMQLVLFPLPRYMLPIVPLLALAWWEGASRLAGRFPRRLANIVMIAAFGLMVPNAIRCMGSIWPEQYGRPFISHYNRGLYDAFWEAAPLVRTHVPRDGILIVPRKMGSVMSYLTERTAIELNEPQMQRFRRREVWILLPRFSPMRNELLDRGFRMEPLTEATHVETRKEGVLVLRKAHWPEKEPF